MHKKHEEVLSVVFYGTIKEVSDMLSMLSDMFDPNDGVTINITIGDIGESEAMLVVAFDPENLESDEVREYLKLASWFINNDDSEDEEED